MSSDTRVKKSFLPNRNKGAKMMAGSEFNKNSVEFKFLKKDSPFRDYIDALISKYRDVLVPERGIAVKFIPFPGGKVIETRVIEKFSQQKNIVELNQVADLTTALDEANIELFDNEGKNITSMKGTKIIINKDIFVLIKDNSLSEWGAEKANQDVKSILKDVLAHK